MDLTEYDETPRPCCILLRCASMSQNANERPGLLHIEKDSEYWCLKTGTERGPDGAVATHCHCQSGRPCYRPGPISARVVMA